MSLSNRHALVCGASRGIGAAVAETLAGRGANVTILARDRDALDTVCGGLDTSQGQQHGLIAVDVLDTDTLASKVAALASQRAVNILVNNSGGPPPGLAHTADTTDFLNAFRQHLLANQVLVQSVLESMRSSGYGRIINIISTSVREPIPGLGVSNTIRGAVASWAKTLAGELGPSAITVNNVLPGYTATQRLTDIFTNAAKNKGHSLEQEQQSRLAEVPLRRFAQPGEIAAAVAFLASPDAGYVNGINLTVDGGRSRGG